MFQDLGNQLECLIGMLKQGEYDWPRSNIAGLETGVSHRERSRLRPICCRVNDLVTALCAITNCGLDRGADGERGMYRRRVKAVTDVFNY